MDTTSEILKTTSSNDLALLATFELDNSSRQKVKLDNSTFFEEIKNPSNKREQLDRGTQLKFSKRFFHELTLKNRMLYRLKGVAESIMGNDFNFSKCSWELV